VDLATSLFGGGDGSDEEFYDAMETSMRRVSIQGTAARSVNFDTQEISDDSDGESCDFDHDDE